MAKDNFKDLFAGALASHMAKVVPTNPRYVQSGSGAGLGIIVQNAEQRLIHYFEGDIGGVQTGHGVVYLPTGKGLDVRNGKDQEDHTMEIRKSSGGKDRWEVHEVFFKGTDGRDPSQQQRDKASQPALSQLDTMRPQPTGSLVFLVKGTFYYVKPDTGERGSVFDLSGTVQSEVAALSSGEHQAAVLYFDTQTGVMAVATATAVTAGSTLPSRNEFYDFTFTNIPIPAYGIPLANVYLYYGQTQLAEPDYYRKYDPRPLFTAPRDAWATLTTTDATLTTLSTIPIAEESAVTVTGEYVATRDDYSAASGGTFRYTVRRALAGSVTQVAAATISQDGTGVLSLTVDTDNVLVQWTGVAAQNWNVRARYSVIKVT